MKPATTLNDVAKNLSPHVAVKKGDEAYVELSEFRGEAGAAFARLKKTIDQSTGNPCWLVTGHRGTGKTTELRGMLDSLDRSNWHTVYIDAETELDLHDLGAVDIIMVLVRGLIENLQASNLPIPGNGERILTFFQSVNESLEENSRQSETSIETKAGAKADLWVLNLIANFSASMKGSRTVRSSVRKTVEPRFATFKEIVNDFISQVEEDLRTEQGKKGLILVLDSLEKAPPKTEDDGPGFAKQFFSTEAPRLTCLETRCILTVPITATADTNLWNDYNDLFFVPALDPENPDAFDGLMTLVKKRIDLGAVFQNPAKVGEVVKASGGSLRDLFYMLSAACSGEIVPVAEEEIAYGISNLRRKYRRLVRTTDLDLLELVKETGQVPMENQRAIELLSVRVFLEYCNGSDYFKVHPLAKPQTGA